MAIPFLFEILIIIFSIILHELSHGYMADYLGDKTARYSGRLTLNPLPHVDFLGSIIVPILSVWTGGFIFGWAKPVPYNPYNLRYGRYGEALVAFAGPLSNLVIVSIFSLILHLGNSLLTPSFVEISTFVIYMNLVLMLFNLVPLAPLDGSKILFAFLPLHLDYVRDWLEKYSLFGLLIFIFFFTKPFSMLLAFFFNFFV